MIQTQIENVKQEIQDTDFYDDQAIVKKILNNERAFDKFVQDLGLAKERVR